MAQIIRHRKGTLEQISGATKRKAEFMIVTGSSGITSTNRSSMAFVGDGTSATPTNKILYGTSTPDLSSGYGTNIIDGMPYYNTDEEKFFLLQSSGTNIEVKASAQTGGTNLLSGSAGSEGSLSTAIGLLGDNIYSSSAQVATDLLADNRNIDLGTGTFDAGTITSDGTLNVTGISNLGVISGSSLDLTGNANIAGNIVLGGNITIGDASSDTISLGGEIASDVIPSAASTYDLGSSTDTFAEIHGDNIYGTINANNGVVSGSAQTITHLEGTGVVSGSTQLDGTALGTTSDIEATGSFTGSFTGDGSGLTGLATNLKISGSTGNDEVDLLNDELTFAGTTNEIETTVTDNTVTIGLPNDVTIGNDLTVSNDLTVTGNLTVSGTQTIVDSTTVQIGDNIIELNGSGATNAGLVVKDATAPNTVSGSLLWDSTNDQWIAGALGSEYKILLANGDSVVSGSSQVTTGAASGELLYKNAGDDTIDGSAIFSDGADLFSIGTATGNVNDIGAGNQFTLYGSSNSGIISFDISGTTKAYDYVASDVRYLDTNTGVGIALKPDADATKSWVIDTDGDLVSNGGSWNGTGKVFADGLIARNDITGSNLRLTGNAQIDGNIVLGGNITVGDADSDTITLTADLSSDIIPDGDNTRDLGATGTRFAEIHGNAIHGTINAKNNVVSGSTDSSTIDFTITDGTITGDVIGGVISGSTQLDGTALGTTSDIEATGSFTGSFTGDGSGLTGLATNLKISGSDGTNDEVDLLNDELTFTSASGQGLGVAVTDNTITFSNVDATTSAKGVASFDSDDFSVSTGAVSIANGGVRAVNLNADVVGDGIELDGTNNDLNVLYGSSALTAVQGNTTATFTGTANEITVSDDSAQAIGGGIAVTIGLPDDVTITDALTVNGNVILGTDTSNTVTINGDLSVLGTTTTIDSTTVSIGDNILELNYGGAATTSGILVKDATGGSQTSGSLLWNATNDNWTGGALGSEKEFARLNASPTTNTIQKVNGDGLLVDSVITDDGTDATFSGDVIVSGLSVGSNGGFVYVDTSNTLQSATATNDGDVIQWNGTSFVASNELDGGGF